MQLLRQAFADGCYQLDLDAHNVPEVIDQTVDWLVQREMVPAEQAAVVRQALLDREARGSTAIGHSVAVPHAYLEAVAEPTVFFVRLENGINQGAPDGIPTRFFFFLIGPPGATAQHLDTLASVARVMADDEFRFDAGRARSGSDLVAAIDRFIAWTTPAAETATVDHEVPEGLRPTGKVLGGIRADWARRLPNYWQDIRDGFHPKCLGSILFLFFACTAPTVIFGGIMAKQTGNQIGVVEMIIATSIGGVLYALLSGQPLIILGGTGPLLVFITILYQGCQQLGVDFLPAYAWTGLWTGLFVILMAMFDVSCFMRFFTRFTDESFSALISMIFIFGAITSLAKVFQGLEVTQHHDTALLTLLLALGTFYIAMTLSSFRRSSFLRGWMREFLADFGPTIALAVMTYVAFTLDEVELDRLPTPEAFGPTTPRDWLVDIGSAPLKVKLGAALPALFGAVLVFLDQNITARIVNSPDHRLQRGSGYHWDLAIVGGLIAVLSMFGLPWLVAATVRSLNHVRSLATNEEVVSRTGTTRERILHVRETRLTGLAIHLLMGGSLLLLTYLRFVPMAVLYGLFLFMGVVSISGNQFFERLGLWLKDPDLYPATHYIRRVPIRTIHVFTGIQLVCLVVLWMIQTNKNPGVAILFPLFIALLVPLRMACGWWFTPEQLAALDAEEEPEEEETHW